MDVTISIPPDHHRSLQRLYPYMCQELRQDPPALEAIQIYYKLGGDKLARIAIDAFNQTHRLKNTQAQRLRLKVAIGDEGVEDSDTDDEAEKDDDLEEVDREADDIPEY